MCVIIIKKKGVELPTEKELRNAYLHNPHGCGFVSSNGVYWRGMRFDVFMKMLQKVRLEDACIIHFRLATHGSHKVANCHPFKAGDLYFAHNGVLPIRTKDDMTDSETMFRNVLAPAAGIFGFGSRDFDSVVNNNIYSSKFAFMKDGEIKFYGSWIREDTGLIWSNLNHRSEFYMNCTYNHYRRIYV